MSEESVSYQFVVCPKCKQSTAHKVYAARFGQQHEAGCVECRARHQI